MCGTDSSAHNIGDYVIAEYVKLYIKKKTDSTWRNQAFIDDWKKLECNNINHPISQSELEIIIQNLPDTPLGIGNKEIIRNKTSEFYTTLNKNRDKSNLSDIIIEKKYKDWFGNELTELNTILEDEIKKYNEKNDHPSTQEKSKDVGQEASDENKKKNINNNKAKQLQNTKSVDDNERSKSDEERKKIKSRFSIWWLLWIAFGFTVVITGWKYGLKKKCIELIKSIYKTNSFSQKDTGHFVKNKNKLQQVNNQLWEQYNQLREQYNLLEKEINELVSENEELTFKLNQIKNTVKNKEKELVELKTRNTETDNKTKRVDIHENKTSLFYYGNSIIDGSFHRVKNKPDDDTIFELKLDNKRLAIFKIYSSAIKRVIANPSFLEGCEMQILNNAQTVKTEVPGEAELQSDGKWLITKKLKVILI